jgi:hypothetical protein
MNVTIIDNLSVSLCLSLSLSLSLSLTLCRLYLKDIEALGDKRNFFPSISIYSYFTIALSIFSCLSSFLLLSIYLCFGLPIYLLPLGAQLNILFVLYSINYSSEYSLYFNIRSNFVCLSRFNFFLSICFPKNFFPIQLVFFHFPE